MSQKQKIEFTSIILAGVKLDPHKIAKLELHSTIDSIGLTCSLQFDDISDLKNILPIHGGELLKIQLKDIHGKSYQKDFYITKTVELEPNASTHSITAIIGVSKDSFEYLTHRTNKCCDGKPTTTIMSKLAPKVKILSKTKDKVSVNFPSWTINKAMMYLCDISVDGKGNVGFLFYENLKEMRVITLQDLLEKSSNAKEFYINAKNEHYKYNIIDLQEIKKQSIDEDLGYKPYKTKVMMYNPDKKKVCYKLLDIDKTHTKQLGAIKDDRKQKELADVKMKVQGFQYKDILKTHANQIIFSSFKKTYHILINGMLDLQVGDLIKLKYNHKFTGDPHPEYSGLWIITKASYHMTNNTFLMKLEIQKNASQNKFNA